MILNCCKCKSKKFICALRSEVWRNINYQQYEYFLLLSLLLCSIIIILLCLILDYYSRCSFIVGISEEGVYNVNLELIKKKGRFRRAVNESDLDNADPSIAVYETPFSGTDDKTVDKLYETVYGVWYPGIFNLTCKLCPNTISFIQHLIPNRTITMLSNAYTANLTFVYLGENKEKIKIIQLKNEKFLCHEINSTEIASGWFSNDIKENDVYFYQAPTNENVYIFINALAESYQATEGYVRCQF